MSLLFHRPVPQFSLIALSDTAIDDDFIYVSRIWRPLRDWQIPRRQFLDELERLYDIDDRLHWYGGTRYHVPNVGQIFDIENRWYSLFLRADETGERPEKFRKRSKAKLRMMALYCDYRRILEAEAARQEARSDSRRLPENPYSFRVGRIMDFE